MPPSSTLKMLDSSSCQKSYMCAIFFSCTKEGIRNCVKAPTEARSIYTCTLYKLWDVDRAVEQSLNVVIFCLVSTNIQRLCIGTNDLDELIRLESLTSAVNFQRMEDNCGSGINRLREWALRIHTNGTLASCPSKSKECTLLTAYRFNVITNWDNKSSVDH
ncbi:hypothetical protein M513_07987 [Trichuris suis]|uniref:Uncharacterized protein n=1 Tax=Trichuris suis TaxID=68888 RepID=A0A085M1J1_9BILA|nr:hypothetical protein M513_07987 [Trichuris suis]